MKKLTPQEKKRLSYERDRRNRFGQSDKASRRLVPVRKAKSRRAYRHAANAIAKAASIDPDDAKAESHALAVGKKRWQKCPAVTLRDAIEGKKGWRVRRFGRKKNHDVSAAKLADDPENILRKSKPA